MTEPKRKDETHAISKCAKRMSQRDWWALIVCLYRFVRGGGREIQDGDTEKIMPQDELANSALFSTKRNPSTHEMRNAWIAGCMKCVRNKTRNHMEYGQGRRVKPELQQFSTVHPWWEADQNGSNNRIFTHDNRIWWSYNVVHWRDWTMQLRKRKKWEGRDRMMPE